MIPTKLINRTLLVFSTTVNFNNPYILYGSIITLTVILKNWQKLLNYCCFTIHFAGAIFFYNFQKIYPIIPFFPYAHTADIPSSDIKIDSDKVPDI